jgi:ferredoxin
VHLPLKRLFFPETEVLLTYDRKADGDIDLHPSAEGPERERVVIGCRPCDVAALEAIDRVFAWDYDDVPYRQQRDRTTIVTFACAEPDGHCFCTSFGGSPHGEAGSDVLAFVADDGSAILKALTEKGRALMERLGDLVQPADDAEIPAPPEVQPIVDPEKIKAWLDDNFESDLWADVTLSCLGCGACSYLCPTCHCFDIVDEATWIRGERRRNWDCCSYSLFTRHASGHNPRDSQPARCRQRVMHKFKYFPERFGCLACVGCGRCVRTCGVGLSLVRVLEKIQTQTEVGA